MLVLLIMGCGNNDNDNSNDNIVVKDEALMVLISADEFQMGDNDFNPIHTVYLDAFYMDKYELTNAQYKKFMDAQNTKHRSIGTTQSIMHQINQ